MNSIGSKLRKLREDKNLSGDELSEIINKKYNARFSRVSISKWENNKKNIGKENLNYYAKYFQVSMDWLIGNNISNIQNKNNTIDTCTIDDVDNNEFYLIEHKGKVLKFYIDELSENEIKELKECKNGVLAFNDKVSKRDIGLLENVLTEIYLKTKLGK
ncbi:helix-turn-helix domain-containing protein [Streptobacillus moniliformis]|uniref:helix-turn-helix domain-containing protein n=1 Tax=Streptobacillus moniliformis TaxID=34105 RepID=UPI0007E3B7BA|nr:helix-turn-helix transcriptional regulator [Streptobacillus moniliformis]